MGQFGSAYFGRTRSGAHRNGRAIGKGRAERWRLGGRAEGTGVRVIPNGSSLGGPSAGVEPTSSNPGWARFEGRATWFARESSATGRQGGNATAQRHEFGPRENGPDESGPDEMGPTRVGWASTGHKGRKYRETNRPSRGTSGPYGSTAKRTGRVALLSSTLSCAHVGSRSGSRWRLPGSDSRRCLPVIAGNNGVAGMKQREPRKR